MRAGGLVLVALLAVAPATARDNVGNRLEGVARIASNARDSQGDTLGGIGSGMALVPGSWQGANGRYSGRLVMLPDRGWNRKGTSDYQARLQYFDVTLTPGKSLTLTFRRTQLLSDAAGFPTTGLDPSGVRAAAGKFPDLPVAKNGHVSLDSEALALSGDGSAWISDEYGPYIYHFDARGRMIAAIRPPDAFIPRRAGKENFSAGETAKGEPQSGRQNNQGFEGISIAPDGRTLFAVTQSALVQDLDPADPKQTRGNVRLLQYDLSGTEPRLAHEYVIALPNWSEGKKNNLVAAQSEILALNGHQLLMLCRDSNGGFTAKRAASNFRRVMLVDVAVATDVKGKYDGADDSIAPQGVLRRGIMPGKLSTLLDINDNEQLARFGLHNGLPNDRNDLYEKWESMALAPIHDPKAPEDYFLFVGSDNDFITQNGRMAGKPYSDSSGANVDSLVLVYRISLAADQ